MIIFSVIIKGDQCLTSAQLTPRALQGLDSKWYPQGSKFLPWKSRNSAQLQRSVHQQTMLTRSGMQATRDAEMGLTAAQNSAVCSARNHSVQVHTQFHQSLL